MEKHHGADLDDHRCTFVYVHAFFCGKDAPEYRRRIECFRDIKEVTLEDSGAQHAPRRAGSGGAVD